MDFRHGSWYREDVYDLLRPRKWKGHGGSAARRQRWCLAWLHLKNSGWASNLPSGWTDRVQTTDFCFCRLFGPLGEATQGLRAAVGREWAGRLRQQLPS